MDAVKLLIVFAFMIVPWILAKLWWWVWFWVAIALVLIIAEAISYIFLKKTISKQFWIWKEKAKTWQKLSILAGMLIFWGYLLMHLFFGW